MFDLDKFNSLFDADYCFNGAYACASTDAPSPPDGSVSWLLDDDFGNNRASEDDADFEYRYLIDGCDSAVSTREPLTVTSLQWPLAAWLPPHYAGRFVAGTLTVPDFDDRAVPARPLDADKQFFCFYRDTVDLLKVPYWGKDSVFKAPGLAVLRTRSVGTAPLRYRFLLEIPELVSLADAKSSCLSGGMKARADQVEPMYLRGCESATDWIDLLIANRQPGEHIDSFVDWHWRLPAYAAARRPRKGWARRRALATIGTH